MAVNAASGDAAAAALSAAATVAIVPENKLVVRYRLISSGRTGVGGTNGIFRLAS
ncbi:hypothetical protein GCM10011273_11510 [Asticcacaulis endophyticus]|uniref:Uncharacterized protein n=1 Tax=Asticcacaulis endophyticus TaxID=1395890 RepID=A0A918PYN5_9CAUL|nr:hypothetical protein GCM10011273_11510 [Asticcacaulis endophyticus]